MNDKDNIILFPTNRIKDKATASKPVDDKAHKKLVEEQTKEFVEGNVDDIAYTLLDKFVNMGIRTDKITFTADLALVIFFFFFTSSSSLLKACGVLYPSTLRVVVTSSKSSSSSFIS